MVCSLLRESPEDRWHQHCKGGQWCWWVFVWLQTDPRHWVVELSAWKSRDMGPSGSAVGCGMWLGFIAGIRSAGWIIATSGPRWRTGRSWQGARRERWSYLHLSTTIVAVVAAPARWRGDQCFCNNKNLGMALQVIIIPASPLLSSISLSSPE